MLQRIVKRARAGRADGRSPLDHGVGFTIRFAYPDDDRALRHLAALDSQPLPTGPLLVAEVTGELWAAVSLDGGSRAVADPFHPTALLVELLRERVNRLTHEGRRHATRHPAITVTDS